MARGEGKAGEIVKVNKGGKDGHTSVHLWEYFTLLCLESGVF